MMSIASRQSQRGITLFVGLIMLVLITLLVTSAFTLSTTNLKSVGNMQSKNEAIAAANQAIEHVLSSPFFAVPAPDELDVDINNDGVRDYVASIATPVCVRASIENVAVKTSGTLPTMSTNNLYNTLWNIEVTVNDAKTGAKTIIQTGTRVVLTQTQKESVCL